MKICHLTSVHPRYDKRIFHKECRSLAKSNYSVHLVIADGKGDETKENIHIHDAGKPPSGRFKSMIKTPKIVYKKAVMIDADIYHLHDPELLPYGIKLKKKGKKVVFDSHEDVPVEILEKTWIPLPFRKIISVMYALYEKKQLKKMNALISVTPHLTDRLKKINNNTYQITNFPPIESDMIDVREWSSSICYVGEISHHWNHENIIESLQGLDVLYFLAGNIEGEQYFHNLSQLKEWGKVNYLGLLSKEKVVPLIQKSSIGMALISYRGNTGYKLGTIGNTKLFEYMLSGIPVIATDFILWKEIVEKEKCGICVNPKDTDAIHNAIKFLINNRAIAKEMGNNGRKAVLEEYNWSTQEKILFEVYKTI